MKKFILTAVISISLLNSFSQDTIIKTVSPAEKWADSVLQSLSIEEMIGQLMVVRANLPNQEYFSVIDQYITKYNIGGVTFFG